jgi:alkylation response protein AidB-like acyl-CoA dehydrogenase
LPVRDDDPDAWRMLADTGFVGLRLPEPVGGNATGFDVALIAEEFGRNLVPVPFLGQAVLAPELLWRAGLTEEALAAVSGGQQRCTVALDPSLGGLARAGARSIAWDARGATHALVVGDDGSLSRASLGDSQADCADLTRVLVPFAPTGALEPIGRLDAAALDRFHALALAMLSADLVGVMQGAVDAAVGYVRDRVQFGVPVGSFQAVQHLAADAKVLLEGARSSMWHAAWGIDELEPADALLSARQAKAYASRAGRSVTEIHVQLYGGIAITWEELAHVRVRRALLDRATFGDEHAHEDAIADARLGPVR